MCDIEVALVYLAHVRENKIYCSPQKVVVNQHKNNACVKGQLLRCVFCIFYSKERILVCILI